MNSNNIYYLNYHINYSPILFKIDFLINLVKRNAEHMFSISKIYIEKN